MSCKYDIIDEGGRKRVRALRPFTVQGRDVCPMELGGYVYDANTLSQDGNCWIFSGSLEYPGVRVMDEAIVDMGNNLPKNNARPKSVIISGNSRIMGAISFETRSFEVAQTPAMFEQGTYTNAVKGNVPVKTDSSGAVCIPAPLFVGTAGKVAITSTAYEARLISLNESGIVTSATFWTVGGPAVTLTSTAPYILLCVRKVGGAAINPADVTAAGVTITRAREDTVRIFNSSIVPVYNGSVTEAGSILRYEVADPTEKLPQANIQNSYLRIECGFNKANIVRANADFIRVNYNLVLTPNVSHYIVGRYRNTNINSPASVNVSRYFKSQFEVSDCPAFEHSTAVFPDLGAMYLSGKTFYFKNCNMPAGSAIHYYDPKVNVWDNIDFTKAMADLGKTAFADTTIVSSNVQGMYRARGNTSGVMGGLLEAASSFDNATYAGVPGATYDSIIYKDCVIKGIFSISGCNVFGGTLGGASKITNTSETAMGIDGSFRIEGNAQVTDTPLKGTGYIGGNAELKNGNVRGHIYMDGNAKYIPARIGNPQCIRNLVMRDNARVLKHGADRSFGGAMLGNSKINAVVSINSGSLMMTDDAVIERADGVVALNIYGECSMRDKASITGTGTVVIQGDAELVGDFNLSAGSRTIYGKHEISSPDDVNRQKIPPTKAAW